MATGEVFQQPARVESGLSWQFVTFSRQQAAMLGERPGSAMSGHLSFPLNRNLPMKLFRIAFCLLAAGPILGGCAIGIPGSVKYQISQSGDGNQYALTCIESSSGNCYIQIDGREGKVSGEAVLVGMTRTLQHAVSGMSFCVSSSNPAGLSCKLNSATFGPVGSVMSVSRS
jgi:hypothetical protein